MTHHSSPVTAEALALADWLAHYATCFIDDERVGRRMLEIVAVLRAPAQCAPDTKLRAALERSMTALDDWLNIYAEELCDDGRVEEAKARIRQYGTLTYIANVQDQNRAALSVTSTERDEHGPEQPLQGLEAMVGKIYEG